MSRVCRRSRAGSAPRWRRQARSTAGRPRPMRRIRPCPPSRPAGAQPGLQRRWHRVFTLRASIAADAGAGLVSTPQGRTLFLVTEALHRSGSDQPQAAGGSFVPRTRGCAGPTMPRSRWGRPNGARCSSARRGRWRWNRATAESGCSIPRMAPGAGRRRPSWNRCGRMPAPTARPSTRRPKGRVDWGRRTGWNIAGRCIRWAKRRPSAGAGACACRPARKRRSSSRRAVSRSPSRTARLRPSASSRRRRRAVPGRVRRIPC